MGGRLFWKILLGFWMIFILSMQLLWAGFTLYGERREPPENSIVRRIVKLQVTSAVSMLQSGGLPALQAMMVDWPANERRYFMVKEAMLPIAGSALDTLEPGKIPDSIVEWTAGPDGQGYRIHYDVKGLRSEYRPAPRSRVLNIPTLLLWLGGLTGLLFSTLLAWNLTRPLRKLRAGFERVAQGDLAVRLLPAMRRRHDELSDVAHDFDQMVERLQQLVSAREQLLHDVSHELRSPLARLQLAIGLARQNPGGVESSLQRIEHEAGRLEKMIGELLTLSRAESENLPDEEYFDLYGLAEAVVNDVRYEAQIPGVQIELQAADGGDYTVKGNAELMRRALENIVRNALRFSQPGQRVGVDLHPCGDRLQVRVLDQGPGVEESRLAAIFDPFVRVASPQAGKGYGLGLAIARKVVVAHGGEIAARNGELGGLEIRIQLPHWSPG